MAVALLDVCFWVVRRRLRFRSDKLNCFDLNLEVRGSHHIFPTTNLEFAAFHANSVLEVAAMPVDWIMSF